MLLPIGIDSAAECVYAVRARMREIKGSYRPLLAYALLAMSGVLTRPLHTVLFEVFLRTTRAVMTNVPGPAEALVICGSTLQQSIFWVLLSGDVGVGVSIVSYAGGVQFGLITDRRRCADPQRVIERLKPEFDKLLLLSLMLPWASEVSRRVLPAHA